jgi:hypothetical protein
MLEYSGLKIDRFADIPVCPRVKMHGYCECHSPRPGKTNHHSSSRTQRTEHRVILPI